ncbi:hypothetical protein BDW75DRAFT_208658 [Aspergillus navahoensis]
MTRLPFPWTISSCILAADEELWKRSTSSPGNPSLLNGYPALSRNDLLQSLKDQSAQKSGAMSVAEESGTYLISPISIKSKRDEMTEQSKDSGVRIALIIHGPRVNSRLASCSLSCSINMRGWFSPGALRQYQGSDVLMLLSGSRYACGAPECGSYPFDFGNLDREMLVLRRHISRNEPQRSISNDRRAAYKRRGLKSTKIDWFRLAESPPQTRDVVPSLQT